MADEALYKKHSFSGEEDPATAGEDELQKLESQVKRMAEEILERRSTLSYHLKTTLASILALHRPVLPTFSFINLSLLRSLVVYSFHFRCCS